MSDKTAGKKDKQERKNKNNGRSREEDRRQHQRTFDTATDKPMVMRRPNHFPTTVVPHLVHTPLQLRRPSSQTNHANNSSAKPTYTGWNFSHIPNQANPHAVPSLVAAPPNGKNSENSESIQQSVYEKAPQNLIQLNGLGDLKNKLKDDPNRDVKTDVAGQYRAGPDQSKVDAVLGTETTGFGLAADASGIADATLLKFSLSPSKAPHILAALEKEWRSKEGIGPNDELTKAQKKDRDEYLDKKGTIGFGDDVAKTQVGNMASAVGVGTGGLGAVSGIFGMALSIKKAKAAGGTKSREGTDEIMNAVDQGAKSFFSGAQGVASLGGWMAGTVGAISGDNAAANAGTAFNGVVDSFGALGSAVTVVMSGARIALELYRGHKDHKEGQAWKEVADERWAKVSTELLEGGKAFLAIANSALSAARFFLLVAGTGSEFLQVFPAIGAAINIVTQAIDLLIQAVTVVEKAIKIHKARMRIRKLRQMQVKDPNRSVLIRPKGEPLRSDMLPDSAENVAQEKERMDLVKNLERVNQKRINRNAIPIVSSAVKILADLLSVTASVLNIAGVASSAGYGAGIGLMAAGYGTTATAAGLKLGAASFKPGAAVYRTAKQTGRNWAANIEDNNKNTIFGHRIFNTDKTSNKKQENYIKQTKTLFKMVLDLPDSPDSPQYQTVLTLIKATGVNTKKLFAKNGDVAEQTVMLIKAMQSRE